MGDDGALAASTLDTAVLQTHLIRIAPTLLDGDEVAFKDAIFKDESVTKLKQFSNDAQCQTLVVSRALNTEGNEDESSSVSNDVFSFELEVQYVSSKTASIVFVKKQPVLEGGRSLSAQLQLIHLGDGSPFETLHSYIHNTFTPFFHTFVAKSHTDRPAEEKESKMGIPAVKKKMAELELSLLHCSQNVEIPEVSLPVDPEVQQKVATMGPAIKVEDFGDASENKSLLDSLQSGVNRWKREIQKVTKLHASRDISSGSAMQEINFWLSLERSLLTVDQQLESPEIKITFDILKQGKRFLVTTGFREDAGLVQALDTVTNYNQLMRDFPINELLACTEVEKMGAAVVLIFSHMKKIKSTKYPFARALKLVEAIYRDLASQMHQVLSMKRLMMLKYEDFERETSSCVDTFSTWDEQARQFQDILRDFARKRGEKPPPRPEQTVGPLQERIDALRRFRKQHEELHNTVQKVLTRGERGEVQHAQDMSALEEIHKAYEAVSGMDVLDVNKEGADTWDAAVKAYEKRIDRVEGQITSKLRDRLGATKNANEMFRVFSKFNALFFRPRIRGAIQEYQSQLIQQVKNDIKNLQDKFKTQFVNSEACHMSHLRDLPPTAGAIIWARQIERQLAMYMKRVEDVLGKGWEQHLEGQKLKADGDSFKKKLNAQHIFEAWVKETEARNFQLNGTHIFDVQKKGGLFNLEVNFDPQIIILFKEVRNLAWLMFRVPYSIQMTSSDAKQFYPYAMSLVGTLRTYMQTCAKLTDQSTPLIASYQKEVQNTIAEGMTYRWDSDKLESYVRRLSDCVSVYQDKVSDLLVHVDQVSKELSSIKICDLDAEVLNETLMQIQKTVDELNLGGYSNLRTWVASLDEQIQSALSTRLEEVVKEWVSLFGGESDEQSQQVQGMARAVDEDTGATASNPKTKLKLKTFVHEIKIRNQVLYLDPPLEQARVSWIGQLHVQLMTVTDLKRIRSSRYDEVFRGDDNQDNDQSTYAILLNKLPDDMLKKAYEIIEKKLRVAGAYVETWLQYQSLWDMDANKIYARLGEGLGTWEKLLNEIKRSRTTFDTSEMTKLFGPLTINFRQVQQKVANKYDLWHKEILNKFGTMLGDKMGAFHKILAERRTQLEHFIMEGSNTAEAVNFVTILQETRRDMSQWQSDVEHYRSGERLLERQRFQFPSNWLYCDMIEGEWSAFNEILNRKNDMMKNEIPSLQQKILGEDQSVASRLKEVYSDWGAQKPLSGNIAPSVALNTLNIFEGRVQRLEEDLSRVNKAKEALGMDVRYDGGLEPLQEELVELKNVWNELLGVWKTVEEMRETPWAAVIPRKTRKALEDVMDALKALPARVRQYEAYDYAQNAIKSYLKINGLIVDLKSEALRDRHWKALMKRLRVGFVFSDMTLGSLWDAKLNQYENAVKDIIIQAEGEVALEHYLQGLKEYWSSFELDLANYQNKCRLVRGWDEMFAKLNEHQNSLGSMKASPFYKVFEEDANGWEDKLNRLRMLFDVWIDVQRRWVYLEGIFLGSADIKQQLPMEFSRFKSINNEFTALMRKVTKNPNMMEVLGIDGIQRSLDRLADLLTKIQKALGEYLERQRAAFPRFYFVGDEDLLEMIGNSKEPIQVQRHMPKMFAAISSLALNEDMSEIQGIRSREGETITFDQVVSVKDDPKIHSWLTKVEEQMKVSLSTTMGRAVERLNEIFAASSIDVPKFLEWVEEFPDQVVVVSVQILWSSQVEAALGKSDKINSLLDRLVSILETLADHVLKNIEATTRKKCENLITEMVHQRDVVRRLIADKVESAKDFGWLYYMRFYWNNSADAKPLERLEIRIANAKFYYGFEYLGLSDKLVQTPLTDKCYLTLTQALHNRLGGSPFGPAGTGKTESVKALGNQLGRFTVVFNCDENFDLHAMGRIFVGLCMCGAWGCFDEFNRLEERILSAVSQQIQAIQVGLKEYANEIELVGRSIGLNSDMGIFVTMNPGYAGRSALPDNLKSLFRNQAMVKPDRELIAQVMLFSQGFRTAERLSGKIVPLFQLCADQLSSQAHYDFGLRALKSVLVSAGTMKRKMAEEFTLDESADAAGQKAQWEEFEQNVLIRSICETIVPKLVADDIHLLYSLLSDVFPGGEFKSSGMDDVRKAMEEVCKDMGLVFGQQWSDKILQLYQILNIHHGVMMVGPSGSGKSTAWRVLMKALDKVENSRGDFYIIDPKAFSKDDLYGYLDATTREWTDGIFTSILRKIIANVRGEVDRRNWIIFDGDVDPEWVENLNSVLDDNKILTLPNGERLALPKSVRIMFEVDNLKYATLATVSRCGMVWFSSDVVTVDMVLTTYLNRLKNHRFEEIDEATANAAEVQAAVATALAPHYEKDGVIVKSLQLASAYFHIMDFTPLRAVHSMHSMMIRGVANILEYNQSHPDFPMAQDHMEQYITRRLLMALCWGLAGSMGIRDRAAFSDELARSTTISGPTMDSDQSLIDYEVKIETGEWSPWKARVPTVEIETHKVISPDTTIPTVDTIRHEGALESWLASHDPLLLCGPPGSGKTMTLTSTLQSQSDYDVCMLNFSSATTPELILKTFDQYCEERKTPEGKVLRPTQIGKWLVVFCDEINLPDEDRYGTQRVITFIRQLIEHGGYWRSSDLSFVKLERIQFVGACNPPTDPGRKPLSERFMRHAPVLYVDFPSHESLIQIFGVFNRALLKLAPPVRLMAGSLTEAMVEFYEASQRRFTPDIHAHYIYSPRELSRWVRALYEALKTASDNINVADLVRLFVHEALRLFQDRLVDREEREWTDQTLDEVVLKHFPNVDEAAIKRPILFSNWLSKDYVSVEREALRDHVKARLKVFYEEELNVPLVIFNEVLDHVLRIDRVLRQPLGHMLLIGVSGGGKTCLTRFVSWMNGLSVFQIKVSKRYTTQDFDNDLRLVMKRAGCKGEKICFIFDESNVLSSSFLERMNALLASGEVPGLFEEEEFTNLMNMCKEAAQRDGVMLDTEEELYKRFTQQVQQNLHVVFTMNPASDDFHNRSATSPALFNRCVLDWFGEWSDEALFQVGLEFTKNVDLDDADYKSPAFNPAAELVPEHELNGELPTRRQTVVGSMVFVHDTIISASKQLSKRTGRNNYVTPRHYLDFIKHFVDLYNEKRTELEEQQLHINKGLQKLKDTEKDVAELQQSLALQNDVLKKKNDEANEKLKQMVGKQQEAEEKRQQAIELGKELEKQEGVITEQREVALKDLAEAEPALLEAKESVQTIKKQHLDEVRGFASPPKLVKTTLEAVALMMGEKNTDWDNIKRFVKQSEFIQNVVKFDCENLPQKVRDRIKREYVSMEGFNFETVNRASKACGPLCKWLIAQIHFSDILLRVEPLKKEVDALQVEADELKGRQNELEGTIQELEKAIQTYKDEYAVLISETQSIKNELTVTATKVERSHNLLKNLSSESVRWEAQSDGFKEQMSTLVGDSLIGAAFLSYVGYFDQGYRTRLVDKMMDHIEQCGVPHRTEMSLVEYLSRADERLKWHANGLPVDDLCVENAIMCHRYNRYPLVIDPSGQAADYLLEQFKDKKITKTSFLDDSFMKNLESALRFGCPLLVQDVESIDPVLNSVLNHEVHKAGGRTLVRLGDQDIDFSPSFEIFLFTRDPTSNFTPDLCSRVTLVNFTVTLNSLQTQCLNVILKTERPDVEQKRSDLLKLQGEFRVTLRRLEQSLLDSLSSVQGNILDDDKIITTLETLKTEAKEVQEKFEKTDVVMEEVAATSEEYHPLSIACSRIYFALEKLPSVHFLYQFSLRFFLDIFHTVLSENPNLNGVKDHGERLSILVRDLFTTVYRRVTTSMMHDDHIAFALRLSQIRLQDSDSKPDPAEYDHLLKSSTTIDKKAEEGILKSLPEGLLNVDQARGILSTQSLPSMSSLAADMASDVEKWKNLLKSEDAESIAHEYVKAEGANELTQVVRELLILKALRPDRLQNGIAKLVTKIFGPTFLEEEGSTLRKSFEATSKPSAPLLLVSMPGHDASNQVDAMASDMKKQCKSLAMGSPETYEQAEKSIISASKSGGWIMLKNVHLSPQWLVQLEKKLHTLTPHKEFRLFLTTELHPKLPVNLLRVSHIYVFEPPPGIRQSLLRTLESIPKERMAKQPVERCRLHFLVSWLHAILEARLRFTPVGWTKKYEFNEADKLCALDVVDQWVDMVAAERTHIPPEKIPWTAIRTLLCESIYGGRIDNDFDGRLLSTFVNKLFRPETYDSNFALISGGEETMNIPEGTSRDAFLDWVRALPDAESPLWIGLQTNAEHILRANKAKDMITKLYKMRSSEDEFESDAGDSNRRMSMGKNRRASSLKDLNDADRRPAWMVNMLKSINSWLEILPESLDKITLSNEEMKDPLRRFFEREIRVTSDMLVSVHKDLAAMKDVCSGATKPTNKLRSLFNSLLIDVVPGEWLKYSVPTLPITAWFHDFARRIEQLKKLSAKSGGVPVWLGGLLSPEAFVTATRQSVAQKNKWSLESLQLELSVGSTDHDDQSFIIEGLYVDGAEFTSGAFSLSEQTISSLPGTRFRWVRKDEASKPQGVAAFPLYLNHTRGTQLLTVDLPRAEGVTEEALYQRGASILAWHI